MVKGVKSGKFWFSSAIPDEVLKACKPVLVKNEHLIPSWCNEVRVYWDCVGEEGAAAYIETNYAYRFAALYICPPMLSEEKEDMDVRFKHELLHIVSAPLIYYVKSVTDIVSKDEDFKALVDRESNEKIESLTEDLAYILAVTEEKLTKKTK